MYKKHSKRFWILLAVGAAAFLFAWFFFWQIRAGHFQNLARLLGLVPVGEETTTELDTLISLGEAVYNTGGVEKTYLILFQNNYELRPGGGYIGSFGILKLKDGHIVNLEVHDTVNFDGRIPDTVPAPYPMEETLGVSSWKLRDSNFAPDFRENANQAEEFYHLGKGGEEFDGVVAISATVLQSFLSITGPVTVPGYPGTYTADNAVLALEYQVEQDYYKQGITFGERKSIIGLIAAEILKKTKALPLEKKYDLFKILLKDLNEKDIQLYFKDQKLEAPVMASHWDGLFDGSFAGDYLYVVDSNMNAFKTDYSMRRRYAYTVDRTKEKPEVTLETTYIHTAKEKNYYTKDYQTYTRVYVPKGSYLETVTGNATPPVYGEYQGRKYFGTILQVPLGTEKTVTYHYTLPSEFRDDPYRFKIQKQPGMGPVEVDLTDIAPDGTRRSEHFTLVRDTVWGASKE
jgi:hypothetical protein